MYFFLRWPTHPIRNYRGLHPKFWPTYACSLFTGSDFNLKFLPTERGVLPTPVLDVTQNSSRQDIQFSFHMKASTQTNKQSKKNQQIPQLFALFYTYLARHHYAQSKVSKSSRNFYSSLAISTVGTSVFSIVKYMSSLAS